MEKIKKNVDLLAQYKIRKSFVIKFLYPLIFLNNDATKLVYGKGMFPFLFFSTVVAIS